MPRAWFRPFSEHARSLFGLPVRYHSAEALQMMVQINLTRPYMGMDETLEMDMHERWHNGETA
eukprot:5197213-Amphidinium_carterae.1